MSMTPFSKSHRTVRDVKMPRLTYAEVSTVLAALRVFQDLMYNPAVCGHDDESIKAMEHFEDVKPLTDSEINALCERINTYP